MSRRCITKYLKTSLGSEIFFRNWDCNNKNAPVIIMLHGIGVHSLVFEDISQFFLKNNYNIYSFDFSGFGKSKAYRGHIENFELLINETLAILKLSELEYPDVPKFILGESLGGVVALHFAKYYQEYFDGLILLSPLVGTDIHIPYKKKFNILFNSLFNKYLLFDLPFTFELLTRDYKWQNKLNHDEANVRALTAKSYYLLFNAMNETFSFAKKINIPVLVIQSRDDVISSHSKVSEFFSKLNSDEKQLFVFNNFYHLLSIEQNREVIYNIIKNWISQRIYLIENYEKKK
jgi:alpha-beta hydrolase superfamily lysophospholipase